MQIPHSVLWGYQPRPEQPRLRCLKLLLDPAQKLPGYVSREDLMSLLKQSGKSVDAAVTDYLTKLHQQAREALEKRFGEVMTTNTKINYVLTVPAVWSDAAKDATLRAAEKAGMNGKVTMISEPEAAAIYALKSMERSILQPGDNFIVCDAGGGTVDLISYEIISLCPLRLEESVPGTGALCGGAFLNMRFHECVKARMGQDAFESMCQRKPKSWAVALKYFEDYVKRSFDPSDSQDDFDNGTYNVPLPGAADNIAAGIDCGFITLSTSDVAEIFRPIIDQIIELIERQRNMLVSSGKSARGVVLVGGFGQSTFLHKSLKTRFADDGSMSSSSGGLSIMQPINAWTAVVRGAVLSGLEGAQMVTSRKARRHYGFLCTELYDPSIHSLGSKYWDYLTEVYRADNQIEWSIKRGDTLLSGQTIPLPFLTHSETVKCSHTCTIIVSDELEAPTEFLGGSTTRILCHLDVALGTVPRKHFKVQHSSNGRKFFKLSYNLCAKFESGALFFDLRINNIVYGSVKARFE